MLAMYVSTSMLAEDLRPNRMEAAKMCIRDRINRAPAKVQSALLEAMQEHQVTIGDETFKLPSPFLVMATPVSYTHLHQQEIGKA